MKTIIFCFAAILMSGCTTMQFNSAVERAKEASVNAASDYGTWIPAASSAVLYATDYDNDVTNHFRKHALIDEKKDEYYRDINRYETLITAVLVKDADYGTKGKRLLVEFAGIETAKQTSTILEKNIHKQSPDGSHNGAIGSHHALDHFASSAMNRRNVAKMDIPTWGKYTLNTLSYTTATASALSRVQDGGHSFSDQLVSASIGNFLGLFFHDLFMLEPETNVAVSLNDDVARMQIRFSY